MLVRVSFGSMDTGAGDVMTAHGRLQTLFDEMQSYVRDVGQSWHGPARDAYLAAQEEWNGVNQRLDEALQGMGTGIRGGLGTFQAAEQRNRSIWAG